MKFFLDTAHLEEIKEAASFGILDGVTTNPSLVAKEGVKDFKAHVQAICKLVSGPVSVEVLELEADKMVEEGRKYATWAKNVVVKLPMTPNGMRALKRLSEEGIAVNMTLIFSANQALLAAKAGARFVSPFVGRLDEDGQDGMALVEEIVSIFENYGFETEVLVASVRDARQVTEAALVGAHVATLPKAIFDKLFLHPRTTAGLENFLSDWKRANLSS
jgi:transaldolase